MLAHRRSQKMPDQETCAQLSNATRIQPAVHRRAENIFQALAVINNRQNKITVPKKPHVVNTAVQCAQQVCRNSLASQNQLCNTAFVFPNLVNPNNFRPVPPTTVEKLNLTDENPHSVQRKLSQIPSLASSSNRCLNAEEVLEVRDAVIEVPDVSLPYNEFPANEHLSAKVVLASDLQDPINFQSSTIIAANTNPLDASQSSLNVPIFPDVKVIDFSTVSHNDDKTPSPALKATKTESQRPIADPSDCSVDGNTTSIDESDGEVINSSKSTGSILKGSTLVDNLKKQLPAEKMPNKTRKRSGSIFQKLLQRCLNAPISERSGFKPNRAKVVPSKHDRKSPFKKVMKQYHNSEGLRLNQQKEDPLRNEGIPLNDQDDSSDDDCLDDPRLKSTFSRLDTRNSSVYSDLIENQGRKELRKKIVTSTVNSSSQTDDLGVECHAQEFAPEKADEVSNDQKSTLFDLSERPCDESSENRDLRDNEANKHRTTHFEGMKKTREDTAINNSSNDDNVLKTPTRKRKRYESSSITNFSNVIDKSQQDDSMNEALQKSKSTESVEGKNIKTEEDTFCLKNFSDLFGSTEIPEEESAPSHVEELNISKSSFCSPKNTQNVPNITNSLENKEYLTQKDGKSLNHKRQLVGDGHLDKLNKDNSQTTDEDSKRSSTLSETKQKTSKSSLTSHHKGDYCVKSEATPQRPQLFCDEERELLAEHERSNATIVYSKISELKTVFKENCLTGINDALVVVLLENLNQLISQCESSAAEVIKSSSSKEAEPKETHKSSDSKDEVSEDEKSEVVKNKTDAVSEHERDKVSELREGGGHEQEECLSNVKERNEAEKGNSTRSRKRARSTSTLIEEGNGNGEMKKAEGKERRRSRKRRRVEKSQGEDNLCKEAPYKHLLEPFVKLGVWSSHLDKEAREGLSVPVIALKDFRLNFSDQKNIKMLASNVPEFACSKCTFHCANLKSLQHHSELHQQKS